MLKQLGFLLLTSVAFEVAMAVVEAADQPAGGERTAGAVADQQPAAGEPATAQAANAQPAKPDWRFRWHNGRWWYWTKSNRWLYWSQPQGWLAYRPPAPIVRAPAPVMRAPATNSDSWRWGWDPANPFNRYPPGRPINSPRMFPKNM